MDDRPKKEHKKSLQTPKNEVGECSKHGKSAHRNIVFLFGGQHFISSFHFQNSTGYF
jgi:hypothetical protein